MSDWSGPPSRGIELFRKLIDDYVENPDCHVTSQKEITTLQVLNASLDDLAEKLKNNTLTMDLTCAVGDGSVR